MEVREEMEVLGTVNTILEAGLETPAALDGMAIIHIMSVALETEGC